MTKTKLILWPRGGSLDGPSLRGHHVQNILQLPGFKNGVEVKDGVRRLNLVVRGVDDPGGTFVWEK